MAQQVRVHLPASLTEFHPGISLRVAEQSEPAKVSRSEPERLAWLADLWPGVCFSCLVPLHSPHSAALPSQVIAVLCWFCHLLSESSPWNTLVEGSVWRRTQL